MVVHLEAVGLEPRFWPMSEWATVQPERLLAYTRASQAERAVDFESGAVLAVTCKEPITLAHNLGEIL